MLADVAAFAVIVLYQVLQTFEDAAEFVIVHGVEVKVRALGLAGRFRAASEDWNGLAFIRAVTVVSVSLAPAKIGA